MSERLGGIVFIVDPYIARVLFLRKAFHNSQSSIGVSILLRVNRHSIAHSAQPRISFIFSA